MWSNGFLQTLELRPGSLASIARACRNGQFTARFRPTKTHFHPEWVALSGSGRWVVSTKPGEICAANLIHGWIFGGGSVLALAWSIPAQNRHKSRQFRAWLLSCDHDPQTWRRLIVRLRLQI
jgi:hypothetical protein